MRFYSSRAILANIFQLASVSAVISKGSNMWAAFSKSLLSNAKPNSISGSSNWYATVELPSLTMTSVFPGLLSISSTSPLMV